MKIKSVILFVCLLNLIQLHAQCPDPSSLDTSNVGPTSAILSWTTGGATNWQIQYDTVGFTPGTGIIVETNANPFTLKNLFPETSYEFYVRDSCGVGSFSNWVGPFEFATIKLFSGLTAEFIGIHSGNAKWGDYDNDGDLDFAITGDSAWYNGIGQIYRNDGGDTFISIGEDLIGGNGSDLDWGDFDNDGDLDLLVTGTWYSIIYRNDNNDVFTNIDAGLARFQQSTSIWGDYDNDGDLDIFISGLFGDSGDPKSVLYRNDDNEIFTETDIQFKAVKQGDATWADINNDLRLDLLITGLDIDNNKHITNYINQGNDEFYEVSVDNSEYCRTVAVGDYDNDGDLDLLYGRNGGKIFRNDNNNSFTNSAEELINLSMCSANWFDFDNDGDLDPIICGGEFHPDTNKTKIFRNDIDLFTVIDETIIGLWYGSIDVGDYDNDGDLDFLITGKDADSNPFTIIYKNNSVKGNSSPDVPTNLNSVNGSKAFLRWDDVQDAETPQNSITYNLLIGTDIDNFDIMPPMSDTVTGKRLIPKSGNTGLNKKWIIDNLPVGTYYWKVHSVDNIFASSAFSEVDSFSILEPYEFLDVGLSGGKRGYSCFGDFDNDDTLDILITGLSNSNEMAQLYNNLGNNNFVDVDAGFIPVDRSFAAVGDYDNDNDLDIIISGTDDLYNQTTNIYRNDGNHVFTNINAPLTGVSTGSLDWGDYDNDGDPDILLTGSGNSIIYENKGNDIFFNSGIDLAESNTGVGRWGDFDNDGDLDIFLAGNNSNDDYSIIYKNQGGGVFVELPSDIIRASWISADLADFDNDGKLDILLAGLDNNSNRRTIVYKNEGDFVFNDINADIRQVIEGTVRWADYNNDGYPDIILTGNSGSAITKVYINRKNNTFDELYDFGLNSFYQKLSCGDYDNDGDIDILRNEFSISKIIKNNDNTPNPVPYPPSNLNDSTSTKGVDLFWDQANDPDGQDGGLSYNIRVGTSPGSCDIVSPMSNLSTGYNYKAGMGNTQLNKKWKIYGLASGIYYWSVQAIDQSFAGGSWAPEQSFTISVVRADFSTDTVCFGAETTFTDESLSSGDPIIQWKWDFGDGNSSTIQNPIHIYATTDTFSVQLIAISSLHSDTITKDVIVKSKPATGFTSDIACQGTSTNFINSTSLNGTTITDWYWDFGDGESSTLQDPLSHGYLNPGDYNAKLVAHADNGCSDSIQSVVTVAEYPVAVITASSPFEFCSGDSVVLSVDYDENYLYTWKIGAANITGGDSSRYTAKISGVYSVEVVNNTGNCTTLSSDANVIVLDAPVPPFISSDGSLLFCQGDSVILSVTENPDYSYQWKLNGGAIGVDTNIYIAKSSGNYTLEVSNSAGCVALSSNSVDITVNEIPTIPSINLSGPTSFCTGDSVIISVTNNPAYTYQWKNEFGNISGSTTNEIIVKETGTYNLEVSNSSNCSVETEPVIVTVSESPSIPVIVYSGSTTFCNGDSIQLSVTNNLSLNYQWELNGGDIGIDTSIYYAKSSGNYTLEVSNSAGCVALSSNSVDIVVNDIPTIPSINLSGPTSFCSGDSLIISVTNNTAYTYQWKNEFGNISGSTTNEITVEETGTYNLEVTNSSNCFVETEPVIVTVSGSPSIPVIVYSGSTTFCNGDSIQLSVTNNTSLDYQWKLNDGAIGIDTNIYYAKSSGNYTLEVSNSSSCVALSSNSVNITVNDIPTIPSINLSGPTSFCAGDSVIISVTNNTAYTYQWKNELGNISGATTNEITVEETGTYNLEVTNSSNCFVETEPVIVTVLESPSIPVIVYSGSTTFCNGDSIQLLVTNNTSLDYQWKLNGGAIGVDTNLYIAKSSGNYILEVSNSTGCVALSSNSVDVTVNEVPDKPVVSLSGLTGFCEGDSLILSADEHAGLTYQWCNENGEILNANNNQYVTYSSGNFYLDITNSSNCTNTSNTTNVTVTEMPLKPVINTTGYDINDCPQEKIILLSVDQPTVQYDYQWKRNGVPIDGETGSTIEDYLNEGDYSVIADNNGCANESDITGIYYDPELPEKPGIIATGPNVWYLACTNDKAQQYEWYYNNEIIGGANKYLYVANQTLGTYFVKIAEENGCFVSSDAVTIPLTATGIDDVNPFANLKIYPNPTPGMFTIEMDNNLFGELITRIFSQNAVEILNIKFEKSTQHFIAHVDLSGQGKGVYLISFTLDKYKAERKIIVE